MLSERERVAKNPHLLFWGRVLVEAKTLSAIIVLFYLHRGLSLSEVFYLSIIWSLTSLMTEVPTGYLADRIGRKRTLLLGVVLLFLSQLITLFAFGFWPFALSFVFMSASFACFSGTEEAMLYESLAECGQEQQMNGRSGKQLSARALPDIFLPAIGAFIASGLLEWQFQSLIMFSMLLSLVALCVLSRLTEPKRKRQLSDQEIGVFTQSLRTIKEEPWLLKVAFNKLLVFIATLTAWRISQPLLIQHGLGVEMLGIFYVVFQSMEFCWNWFAREVEEWFGTARVIAISAMLMIAGFLVAVLSSSGWVVFIALAIGLSANGMREPMFAHAVNKRIHSHSRATTLSNLNVLKGFLDIPLLLLAGWLSAFSLFYPLFLAIALCLVVLVFFSIRSREIQS